MATELTQGPLSGQGLASGARALKHQRLLWVIDDDEEEEEAALDIVCKPRSHPEMVPAPSARPAEDPPTAQAPDKSRPDQAQPTAVAGHAKRRIFSTSHRSSNL